MCVCVLVQRVTHIISNIAGSRKDCVAVISPERSDVVNAIAFTVDEAATSRLCHLLEDGGNGLCTERSVIEPYLPIFFHILNIHVE